MVMVLVIYMLNSWMSLQLTPKPQSRQLPKCFLAHFTVSIQLKKYMGQRHNNYDKNAFTDMIRIQLKKYMGKRNNSYDKKNAFTDIFNDCRMWTTRKPTILLTRLNMI